MAISEQRLFDALSWMPFIDSAELALTLGEPHTTVHRNAGGRVSHGTVHLPSSHRYYLRASGIRQAAEFLDFDTPSDFVRA